MPVPGESEWFSPAESKLCPVCGFARHECACRQKKDPQKDIQKKIDEEVALRMEVLQATYEKKLNELKGQTGATGTIVIDEAKEIKDLVPEFPATGIVIPDTTPEPIKKQIITPIKENPHMWNDDRIRLANTPYKLPKISVDVGRSIRHGNTIIIELTMKVEV